MKGSLIEEKKDEIETIEKKSISWFLKRNFTEKIDTIDFYNFWVH